MAKIITFANQKGGVGKTTTAFAFSTFLSEQNFKVLGVDFDPQGNFTRSMHASSQEGIFSDVFQGKIDINDAIETLKYSDFIPADIFLNSAEKNTVDNLNRHFLLKKMLKNLKTSYDYILIDTPPSLGFFTLNALIASNEIIMPSTANTFAVDGMIALNNTVEMVREVSNPELEYNGAILTRYKSRTRAGNDLKEITKQIGEKIGFSIYNQTVRDSTVIEDSYISGISFLDYDKSASVVQDYKKVVEEFLEKENTNGRK